MIYFPDYSDLAKVSSLTRSAWENEIALRAKYRSYYSGAIFQERVPSEADIDGDIFMYPVGLNLTKMLCIAQSDSIFGEWDDQVVNFEVRKDEEPDDASLNAIELLSSIMHRSNANSMLWEVDLDRNVYGGGVIKVSLDLSSKGHIRWGRVPLEAFFPIFDPDDPDNLLEVYVVIEMTKEQAATRYGYDGSNDRPVRIEHWTLSSYENLLDNKRIDAFSGINPWGIIPFVYIPRFRTSNFYGDAMTEEIIPVQNEFNMRVADIGEAINYNAHPVRFGYNLPRAFNSTNYSLEPNALWDLGRVIGQSPEPHVGILEAKEAVQQSAFTYINFLYDWSRTASFSPPIAFGEDNGGGQRSGETLEIRMQPLVKSIRRSRSYMSAGLSRLITITGLILKQKNFSDIPARSVQRLLSGEIAPRFFELLPRNHQAIVDEVVKLFSTPVPAISIETSQKILGRGLSEVNRIKAMMKDPDFSENFEKKNPLEGAENIKESMFGKMQPQTKTKMEDK